MAVPKEKVSKARRNSRKANWKISTPSIMKCSHCHEPKQPHKMCKNCGYYDGAEIVSKKEKENN